jgi:hypothetical protein
VAGRIRPMEKSSDIENQIHNLLACGIMPQPTTEPRTHTLKKHAQMNVLHCVKCMLKLSDLNENENGVIIFRERVHYEIL